MFKKLLLVHFGILPFLLSAQVNMSAQLPPAGMIQKDQLWNLILINNKEDILDVNIRFILQDRATGQVVLSAQGGNLLLGKGAKAISSKDVQPIIYNYNAQDFIGTFLPMGSYTICYQMSQNGGEAQPFAEECVQINIDPLSPPLLNYPPDQSEIQTPYPLFTWMPPTPSDMFSNLNYDLIVSEVLPGQAPSDAIQNNLPVYTKNNILQPSENYSTSFTALQPNKLYAWQVIARNGLGYAVKTEVWTFTLTKESAPAMTNTESYILLDDGITGVYHVQNDILHIKYYSFTREYTALVEFSDKNGSVVKSVNSKIVPGNNYLEFDLKNNFQKGRLYKVSITDMSKKNHSLTFSIK